MLMLKCRVIKLNLLFKIESHSSSLSFLNSLNIIWFAMRKKEGKKEEKIKRKCENEYIVTP
jgi:hypothetical protein